MVANAFIHKFSNLEIKSIIFDLGGVLIGWNPQVLYKKIFKSEEAVEYFLKTICTSDWNEEQDGGRTIKEGTRLLVKQFPQYKSEIEAFYNRWTEMLTGEIKSMVELLEKLKNTNKYTIVALTNWSAETWPFALQRFSFLLIFDHILVSGQEGMRKPDHSIYKKIMLDCGLVADSTIFIDDNFRNIKAAEELGIHGEYFCNQGELIARLNPLLS